MISILKHFFTLSLFLNSMLGASQEKALFSPDGGVKEEVLSALENAQCSIDAAVYSFSDKDIWDALNTALGRGVTVRVILDKSMIKGGVSCKYCEDFLENGGQLKVHSLTMHHKFSVVDKDCSVNQPLVMTGSGNWSRSSSSIYDEDFLLYSPNSPNFADALVAFSDEFNYIWRYSRSLPDANYESEVNFEPTRATNFGFTSENMIPTFYKGRWTFRKNKELETGKAGETLIAAINSAEKQIKIATAHFRRVDIYKALVEASKRGVEITLVTDGQEVSYVKESMCSSDKVEEKHLDECFQLKGYGKVLYKYYSVVWNFKTAKQMHSKYMVVDGIDVYTGSFNWSVTAEFKNLENLIVLKNTELAKRYLENFETLSTYGKGQYEVVTEEIKKNKGKGPCHFNPMSIGIKDIYDLRSLAKKGYCR